MEDTQQKMHHLNCLWYTHPQHLKKKHCTRQRWQQPSPKWRSFWGPHGAACSEAALLLHHRQSKPPPPDSHVTPHTPSPS